MATDLRHESVWPTFLWALLAFCVFGALMILAVSVFSGRIQSYDETRAQQRREAVAELRKTHAESLDKYGWIDQEAELVHVPIERAMELTVSELKRKPVKSSGVPVVPPAPAPVDGAAATEQPDDTETPEAADASDAPGQDEGSAAAPEEASAATPEATPEETPAVE